MKSFLLYFFVFSSLLFSNQALSTQIYGSAFLGYYYLNLFVGNPPQLQTVIIDTGSWLTAFPCSECGDCGIHYDKPFDIKNSSTARILNCGERISNFFCNTCTFNSKCSFSISYSEGSSLSGIYFEDEVRVGDSVNKSESTKILIGCTTKETNLFRTQYADGILGLGLNTNTKSKSPNIIDYFANYNKHPDLTFSLCLGHTEGGFINFKGYNQKQHIQGEKTGIINFDQESKQYNIQAHTLKVGNKLLNVSTQDFIRDSGTFLDTGTTLSYLKPKIFEAIMKEFNALCEQNLKCASIRLGEKCFLFQPDVYYEKMEEFYKVFPNIVIGMDNDYDYVWEPKDYLYTSSNHSRYCFGFQEGSGSNILGSTFLRSHDIMYDRSNKKIHITKSHCSKGWTPEKSPKHDHNLKILQEKNSSLNMSNFSTNSSFYNKTDISGMEEGTNKTIILVALIAFIILAVILVAILIYIYWRRKVLLNSNEKMTMLNKNSNEKNKKENGYQQPEKEDRQNEQSRNEDKIITIEKNGQKTNNVYQIDDNAEFSNSIELNYQINIDTNNGGNNNFSDINFDNIDKRVSLKK